MQMGLDLSLLLRARWIWEMIKRALVLREILPWGKRHPDLHAAKGSIKAELSLDRQELAGNILAKAKTHCCQARRDFPMPKRTVGVA